MKSLSEARQSKILILFLSLLSAGLLALLILPKIPQIRMMTFIFLITAFQSFFLLVCVLLALALSFLLRRQRRLFFLSLAIGLLALVASFFTVPSSKLVSLEEIPPNQEGEIRILSWNTDGRVVDQDVIDLALLYCHPALEQPLTMFLSVKTMIRFGLVYSKIAMAQAIGRFLPL